MNASVVFDISAESWPSSCAGVGAMNGSTLAFKEPRHVVQTLTVVIISGAHGIAAEVAVITALEFTLSAPLEDSSISC